tara:strand:+ start:1336 stop:1983 length:648 start_codon:yes stop_codon:yes gene_type:complete
MLDKKSHSPESIKVSLKSSDGEDEFSYMAHENDLSFMKSQMLLFNSVFFGFYLAFFNFYSGPRGEHLPLAGFLGLHLLALLVWVGMTGIMLYRMYLLHNLIDGFEKAVSGGSANDCINVARSVTTDTYSRTYYFVSLTGFLTLVMYLTLGWNITDLVIMSSYISIAALILINTEFRKGIPYVHAILKTEQDGKTWSLEGNKNQRAFTSFTSLKKA